MGEGGVHSTPSSGGCVGWAGPVSPDSESPGVISRNARAELGLQALHTDELLEASE